MQFPFVKYAHENNKKFIIDQEEKYMHNMWTRQIKFHLRIRIDKNNYTKNRSNSKLMMPMQPRKFFKPPEILFLTYF